MKRIAAILVAAMALTFPAACSSKAEPAITVEPGKAAPATDLKATDDKAVVSETKSEATQAPTEVKVTETVTSPAPATPTDAKSEVVKTETKIVAPADAKVTVQAPVSKSAK